jgi:hypothetical protein
MNKKIEELPKSDDEIWEGGEQYSHSPIKVDICATHTKENWEEHVGYLDNHDGTVSCKWCGWGTRLAGYQRVFGEKIVDLRGFKEK